MYKVFIYGTPLFFTESVKELSDIDERQVLTYDSQEDRGVVFSKIKHSNQPFYVIGSPSNPLRSWFFSDFEVLTAAGGLVVNQYDEILFILRNGVWDLPKGKIEQAEEVELAAVREVEEECGIHNPVIEKELITTYHTYKLEGEAILKPTYWFLMKYSGNEKLLPQVEEGITQVAWVAKESIEEKLQNTYGSIVDVIREYLSL